jgi:hypothetical protein
MKEFVVTDSQGNQHVVKAERMSHFMHDVPMSDLMFFDSAVGKDDVLVACFSGPASAVLKENYVIQSGEGPGFR